jgi:hypothetical protein
LKVVRWYQWTGRPHATLFATLRDLLGEVWRCRRIAVDATGLGEPVASFLAQALGRGRVRSVKFTQGAKSELGYALLSAVSGGRVKAPTVDRGPLTVARGPGPGAPATVDGQRSTVEQFWRQCELAQRSFRPNQTMNFFVSDEDGHDDFVMSLALVVAAAEGTRSREARGRVMGDG